MLDMILKSIKKILIFQEETYL